MEGKVPAVMGEITGPEPEVGLTQRTRPERPTLFSSSSAGLLLLKLDMQVHSFIFYSYFLFIYFYVLFV